MADMVAHSSEHVAPWLWGLRQDDRAIVNRLRAVITAAAPQAHEIVYHDALGYGPTASGFDRIFYIAPFADHITLGFFDGAGLDDPHGILRGSGKQMRHIRITSLESATDPAVRHLLDAAWTAGLAGTRARRIVTRK